MHGSSVISVILSLISSKIITLVTQISLSVLHIVNHTWTREDPWFSHLSSHLSLLIRFTSVITIRFTFSLLYLPWHCVLFFKYLYYFLTLTGLERLGGSSLKEIITCLQCQCLVWQYGLVAWWLSFGGWLVLPFPVPAPPFHRWTMTMISYQFYLYIAIRANVSSTSQHFAMKSTISTCPCQRMLAQSASTSGRSWVRTPTGWILGWG